MLSRAPLIGLRILISTTVYVLLMLFSSLVIAAACFMYLMSIRHSVTASYSAIESAVNSLTGTELLLFLLLMFVAFSIGIIAGTYVLRKTIIPPFLRWYKRVDPVAAYYASATWGVNQDQPSTVPESVIDEAERELLGFNPLKHPDIVGKSGLEKQRALRRLGDKSMQREWARLLSLLGMFVLFLFLVFLFNGWL